MKPTIDPATLRAAGITVSADKEAKLIAMLQVMLEKRVGEDILATLSPEKAAELDEVAKGNDEAKIGQWIADNVPEYEAIADDAYDILMGEVATHFDELLATIN